MEIQNQEFETRRQELNRQRQGSRLFSVSLVLLFFLVSGGTGYLYALNDGLDKDILEAETQIEKKTAHITDMLKDDTGMQLQASRNLEKVKNLRTEWSKLAQGVLALEMSDISFLQFSINKNSQKVTVSGEAKNYQSIVRFLTTLKNNPQVENSFISSVNESASTGDIVSEVSFQLTFDFSLESKRALKPSKKIEKINITTQ